MAFWVPWFRMLGIRNKMDGRVSVCATRGEEGGDVQGVELPVVCLEVSSDELLTLRLLAEVVRGEEDFTPIVRLLEDIIRDMLRVLLLLGLVRDRHVRTFESCFTFTLNKLITPLDEDKGGIHQRGWQQPSRYHCPHR